DTRPRGLHGRIGHEWDLVFGYEPTRRFEVRATLGRFFPGPAFEPGVRAATTFRTQFKMRF
ncbi:MAG: hypothetical protein Q9Q13_03755, partial [Acidobacteriota bacterium]|nr:hypothetical protein [Acidobacteriota bacterium]